MANQRERSPGDLSNALQVIADRSRWEAAELALLLEYCADILEGDRVFLEVAKYKEAAYSGWIGMNLKGGNVTELRLNPDVRGGLTTFPKSRNPLKNFTERFYSRNGVYSTAKR